MFGTTMMGMIWICVLLSLLAQQSSASLMCTGPDGFIQTFRSAQIYFTEKAPSYHPLENTPAMRFPDVHFLVEEGHGVNISGFAVLCPTTNPPLMYARLAQQKGALAIIFGSEAAEIPGRSTFNSDIGDGSEVTIPIIEVGTADFLEIEEYFSVEEPVFNVTIYYEEGNSWIEFFDSNNIAVLYALGIGIPAAVGVALSVFKLYKLERTQPGCRWSVGQSCLTCHLIACSLRLIYVIIDPLGCRRLVQYGALTLLATLPFPFILTASLLLCFYWHESMSSAMVFPFLKRLRIPFFVLCAVIISVELVTYFFRIFSHTSSLVTHFVSVSLYFAILFGIGTFYIVVSVKLLTRLNNVTLRNNKLKKMTALILGSVCCYVIAIIGIVILPFPKLSGTELGWAVVNFLVYLSLVGVSICQILVFAPRSTKSKCRSGPT